MPPRRLRAPAQGRRSCRDRPVEGSSVEEPSASIVDPPPTRPASASLTDAAGPSNPHRRQTARPTPAGSLYGAVAVKHLCHGWPHFIQSFLVRPGSPFLRPDPHLQRRRAQGPSRSAVAHRPHLYGLEHAGMLVGGRDDAVEGSSPLAARRASHHNLVFGGPRDPNHDAVLRIGRETPKWRAHSSLRHCSHRTSAGCPPPRTVIGALLPRTPNS